MSQSHTVPRICTQGKCDATSENIHCRHFHAVFGEVTFVSDSEKNILLLLYDISQQLEVSKSGSVFQNTSTRPAQPGIETLDGWIRYIFHIFSCFQ